MLDKANSCLRRWTSVRQQVHAAFYSPTLVYCQVPLEVVGVKGAPHSNVHLSVSNFGEDFYRPQTVADYTPHVFKLVCANGEWHIVRMSGT